MSRNIAPLGVALAAVILAAAAPSDGLEPLEDRETMRRRERRREITALREIVMRGPGGIFAPKNRSREEARRVRQMERAAKKAGKA